ncbi:MAG: aldehyde ferredoxin oxidoreductase family protein [Candidatus Rokubacteria bacterium]|nr:aldehyde ferredoxin oxidoreductase family protein [Candidatus Rokubacteria bacterium]
MFAYAGKLLFVDLSTGRHWTEPLSEMLARKHLGSRGFGAHLLMRDVPRGADPLGPDNRLIFMTGPLVGGPTPGSGRSAVITKSPATGYYGEALSGGRFWHALKYAGYDGLVLEGAAERPVSLVITDETVEIQDAGHLWGKTVLETEEALKSALGADYRVASIGPAGERGVLFAAVMNDTDRAAARTGVGTVMGAKRVKAIAVRGTQPVKVFDPAGMMAQISEMSRIARNDPWGKSLHRVGTSGGVVGLNKMGILPALNWRDGTFDLAPAIVGDAFLEKGLIDRKRACMACTLACTNVINLPTSAYGRVNPAYGGPEYESVAGFGSQLGIGDPVAIAHANQLCNAWGMDTISTGSVIAFAMEALETGLLKESDIGFPLRWGDAPAVLRLIPMIARREGIGDLLARGTRRMAERLGPAAAELAVHVKGLEVAMHEPRGKVGLMLSYAASPRGATHMEALHDPAYMRQNAGPELGFVKAFDRFELPDEKVAYVKRSEDFRSAVNSLCLCVFLVKEVGGERNVHHIVAITGAATGWGDFALEEFLKIGERNWNLARSFSVREGCRRTDDAVPLRFTKPLPSGTTQGKAIDPQAFARALDAYYDRRGWTRDGVPTRETLEGLELDDAARQLHG